MQYPECYLHIICCASGEEWIQEIKPMWGLDLKTRIKRWLRDQWGGEIALDGEIMPKLDGEYYAKIITDHRPPDSVIVWDGGGFYTKIKE